MIIKYLFSSPQGDVSLGPEDLKRPFLIKPSERHPFLILRDYFESVKKFISKDRGKLLIDVLSERINKKIDSDSVKEIWIRSEKHGVLYHIASLEIFLEHTQIKLAVSTAVSEKGRACLTNEYEMLKTLNRSLSLPYLPKVYDKGVVECQDGNNHYEKLTMILSEWFEDYHEWHLSIDDQDNRRKVCIWDLKNGHRYASEEEAFEIFRQASKILAMYYDAHTFKQIYPWHHAAGDFIVKTGDHGIHVKLTTVRKYQSIMDYFSEETVNPMIAIIYFFLNLTVRMRLDKLEGVGETVWAGDFAVRAATTGFFEGLSAMKKGGRFHNGGVNEVLLLFQTFSEQEFEQVFQSLHILYEKDDPVDLSLVQANLKSHIRVLCHTLQKFHL